ncbi:hypothetical protein [Streptomyces huiliensis]|uniref:hypothetical protein n=1 Tax=Streptomyces huiliensis TaxID=2876027 RepID=UPI001CBFA3D0|nr:hypothetical protein [Streptomyces huiliensis]MBZ4322491.1 hypothetical protein [Streptomyces huiliensis]
MTGPEHYREAERLLFEAEFAKGGLDIQRHMVTKALVHATLAHTAATVLAPETHTGCAVLPYEEGTA